MSLSPIMVTDIAVVALGASITMRSQISLPLAAESRVAFAITSFWPGAPLVATVLISVAALGLRRAAGRTLRRTGADAATVKRALARQRPLAVATLVGTYGR